MNIRHLVLFIVVLSIGFFLQQLDHYLTQWDALHLLRSEVIQRSAQIEDVMYQEDALRQQLKQAEQRNAQLRRLFPETLQAEQLEQHVAALASQHHIKVLATRTAINSRPGYSEATIDITLEAADAPAKRFMRELKSIPRRIHIVPPEKRGKKNIHLLIIVYAVPKEPIETFMPPHCIEMPAGLWLPPLQDRLTLLYKDYSKQCHFVTSYAGRYLEQLRLLALQKDNTRLQVIEQQLRNRP